MINCHGSSAYTDYDAKKKAQDNLNKIMTGTNATIAVIAEIPRQYGGTPGKIFSASFTIVNNQITFSVKNSDDLNNNQVAYFEKLATDILVGAAIGALAVAAIPELGVGALAIAAAGVIAIVSDLASDVVYPIYQDVKDALANNRNYNLIDPNDTRRCHPP